VSDVQTGTIETRIPGRLDRLPWARWHWLVVIGLGLSESQIGLAASLCPRACLGALVFFALAGANAAYLTGSEIFPVETRAMALAFFYAVGTGVGWVTGPALFGKLVETEKEINVFYGYLIGAVLMIAAGIAEWFIGVEAAGRFLEDVARPLTAEEDEDARPEPSRGPARGHRRGRPGRPRPGPRRRARSPAPPRPRPPPRQHPTRDGGRSR
jgi:MFS family permease